MDLKAFNDSAKELLLRDDVRNAFMAWFKGKYPSASNELLVKAVNSPIPATWNQFQRSLMWRELPINNTNDTTAVNASILSLPITENVIEAPIAVDTPVDVPIYTLTEVKAVPEEVKAVPIAHVVHVDGTISNTNGRTAPQGHDIIAALAKGLEEYGFSPMAAQNIDADMVAEISRKEAKIAIQEAYESETTVSIQAMKDAAVGAVLDAIDSGLIVTRHETTIRINDAKPVVVDGVVPKWFNRALKLAQLRKNILLVGPKGSGKTHAAAMIAKSLRSETYPDGFPFYFSSLTAGVDESEFKGVLNPLTGEYIDSNYIKAYKYGGVYLGDEFDAADANVTVFLHASLSNGHLSIPLRKEEPVITKHEDFVFIGAANTHLHGANRSYIGRNQLDGATIDRFALGQINVDYDEQMEKQLYIPAAVNYGQRLRARCRNISGWTRDVSTRNIKDAHDLFTSGGFSLNQAWYGFFADWKEQELSRVDVVIDHDEETAELH